MTLLTDSGLIEVEDFVGGREPMHRAYRFHRNDLLKPDFLSEFVLVAVGLLVIALVVLVFSQAAG